MAYFPFFIEIGDKEGLIVGGGRMAVQKARKLLEFGISLTVVAPDIQDFLWDHPQIKCEKREFREQDLDGKFCVIAATNDGELNAKISKLCRTRNQLVNVVDQKEECGFLFPSLIKKGDLTIGISTSGSSPGAAVSLRKEIESLLPEKTEEILAYLGEIRVQVKRDFIDRQKREEILKEITNCCLKNGRRLSDTETETIFREFGQSSPKREENTDYSKK